MAKSGIQYDTIGPNRSVDGDAVPSLDNYFEGASQDFVAGAFLGDDGAGNLIELLRTVTGVTVTNAGSAYTSAPTVTATVRGALVSATITNGGSNYIATPTLSFSGSGGGAATAVVDHNGKLTQIIVTTPGSYSAVPTITITAATNPDGTSGTGAAATAVIDGLSATAPTFTARVNGSVAATVTVTAAGSGYTSIPGVYFSAPNIAGGIQATGHAVLSTTTVGSIVVDNPGTGYTSAPTITIAGGGGTGATATCTISGALYDVVVATAGAKLVVPPTLAFSGGAGSGAAATATMYFALASVIAVADGDGHNTSAAAAERILAHTIRGYRDEFSGTLGTTNFARATHTLAEFGAKRDPLTKRHYIDTAGSGIVIDTAEAAGFTQWEEGDSYPIVNFHVRSTYLKLA